MYDPRPHERLVPAANLISYHVLVIGIRLVFFAAVLFVLFMPEVVSACTCVRSPSACDTTWKSGEVVFLGTVTAKVPIANRVREGEYRPPKGNEFHFSKVETFRGQIAKGEEIVVQTGNGGGDCGYPFIVGTTYLVYASTHDNQFTTSICSKTAPEVLVSGVLRELRKVRDGNPPATLFGTIGIGPRGAGYEDLLESKPLAGIRVRAIGSTTLHYSTTTDHSGAYSFKSLPSGTYRLEMELPKGLSTWQQNRGMPFTVQVGLVGSEGGCRADLFARPDGRISGVVTDAGGPIAGFVTVKPDDPEEAEAASRRGGLPGYETEDGNFSLQQIPPGRYVLLFYPKIAGQVRFDRAVHSDQQ